MLRITPPGPYDPFPTASVPWHQDLLGHGGAGAGGGAGSPAHRSVLGCAPPELTVPGSSPGPQKAVGTCLAIPPEDGCPQLLVQSESI